ncbi:MAG: hypothetical protein KJP00_10310 [Bacteroidia bacterium]|nr:hypothetical protein [Bacteroidia bacterium]
MNSDQLIENTTLMHKDHRNWLSQLNFYQDEIKFFQNELASVIQSHMGSLSIIESVDEYKGIFLKKLEKIDDLRHAIASHESSMAASYVDSEAFRKQHQEIRKRLLAFVEEFEMLKKNFKRFAAHND